MLTCALPRHHQPLDERDGGKQENSERAQPDETRPGQGPSSCELAARTRLPSPATEPTNSPMTAPITASVMATFDPANMKGRAAGI